MKEYYKQRGGTVAAAGFGECRCWSKGEFEPRRWSDMKAQRQLRKRMRKGTEKTQRKSARRRQKQHKLKSGHSKACSAAYWGGMNKLSSGGLL